ncbi:homocysteine S-methyltransferase isoform X1 [Cryptotermes secundus]|uniref:homocysteine S-methyltransferase isoform X1 n=1 Tax=Cryptotermes secundus TaxID=105785 RepID=UPI001454D901|nr:homocysteine S-methyltransferase isoform X1 [Cryptotermes secundus]
MCALESRVCVVDGGFATQLCNHVSDPIDGTPLWSASFLYTNQNAVIKTHLDFLRAGADVLMTNTYQASIGGFIKYLGLSKEASYELIKTAVSLAKLACSLYATEVGSTADARKILIAGAVGPYGTALHDCSEYTGSYVAHVSRKEIADWHRPRIQALVEAGVDILAFETIPAQSEGEALMDLLKEFPEQKAWLSFSCKDEFHTCYGEKFQSVARRCWEINPSQLVAVGVNCVSPKYVSPLLRGINADRSDNPFPLIASPNSGENYDIQKGWTDREKCCPVENYVPEWLTLGVTYIGGCCRTYAADIARIKEEVNKWTSERKKIKINGHT